MVAPRFSVVAVLCATAIAIVIVCAVYKINHEENNEQPSGRTEIQLQSAD